MVVVHLLQQRGRVVVETVITRHEYDQSGVLRGGSEMSEIRVSWMRFNTSTRKTRGCVGSNREGRYASAPRVEGRGGATRWIILLLELVFVDVAGLVNIEHLKRKLHELVVGKGALKGEVKVVSLHQSSICRFSLCPIQCIIQ